MPYRASAEQRGNCLHIEKFCGDACPRIQADRTPIGSGMVCRVHVQCSSGDGTMPTHVRSFAETLTHKLFSMSLSESA